MWSNYKGEFTYYISFALFPRLVMTHLIKLPTLLETKFKRYIVNIWTDWCWSLISGLSYNITRNYEVVIMIESALVGQWVCLDESMWVIVRVQLACFPEYFWKAIPSSSKHFGLVIYMMSNPNHGFMQEGWFLEINILPLLAFGPLDAVHKNKCSDKQFSFIEDCLGWGC